MTFEETSRETAWEGDMISVDRARFRHEDGEEATREIARHPGAVTVLAHDGESLFLVRQPREAVGDPGLLELPAGKLDVDGEEALDAAKRELAEEIGKGAKSWKHLATFWSSPGFSDERVLVYMATDLYPSDAESDENERIEVVEHPLARIDDAISACHDAKSLAGLLWFRAYEA